MSNFTIACQTINIIGGKTFPENLNVKYMYVINTQKIELKFT